MAVVKNNAVLAGASGKLGNLVYRQMNGKTFLQCAPRRTAPYNAAQKKQQGRFQEAMAYARTLLADAEVKAEYTSRAKAKGWHWNAFNLAVSEWLRGEVGEVHGSLPIAIGMTDHGEGSQRLVANRKSRTEKGKDTARPILSRLFVNEYGELKLNEPMILHTKWDSS